VTVFYNVLILRVQGPIVRINPWEVHIDDVEYYETLYAPSAPYSKLKFFENRFNMPQATFATADFHFHKPRRAALAPFFSTRRIQGHAPFIQSLVERICARLTEEYQGKGKALILNDVYGCLSGDVITNLAFARSYDLIGTKHWESPFTIAVNNLIRNSHLMTHFEWIVPTMNCIPDKLLMALSETFKPIIVFRRVRFLQLIPPQQNFTDEFLLGNGATNQRYPWWQK
jgi:cytochrome P450